MDFTPNQSQMPSGSLQGSHHCAGAGFSSGRLAFDAEGEDPEEVKINIVIMEF
jgi:hypothetical protein